PPRAGIPLRPARSGGGGGAARVPQCRPEAAAHLGRRRAYLTGRMLRSPERGRPGRTKARDDRLDSPSGLTATTLRRGFESGGLARRFPLDRLSRERPDQPPLPTLMIGALRTMWASFSVSFAFFSRASIWSSWPRSTGFTPFFQVSQTSSQSG